jgi:hypothetical protein
MEFAMRIVIATAQAPFVSGGAEFLAKNLCDALIKSGHETELVMMPFMDNPIDLIEDHIVASRLLYLVISPSGELCVCLVGALYKAADETKRYCFGRLQEIAFDAAWLQRREFGALDHAENCPRCNNPCDIEREQRYFGFSYKLTETEIERWFLFSGEDIYWETGWHALECYESGSHRWMAAREASVLCKYPVSGGERQLSIAYFSSIPKDYHDTPMRLDISIDGETYLKQYIVKESEEISFFVHAIKPQNKWLKVSFWANRLWKPSDVFGSADDRELGIAVQWVRLT